MRKIDHIIVTATLRCLSGTRIGGSDDLLQIGGADLTCIKHPKTRVPYIPGTSLKGKLRSELEKYHEKYSANGQKPCDCADCVICRVFGPHGNKPNSHGPTRILVRDAPAIGETVIETKASTAIDRSTGKALGGSLRQEERVAAGATFAVEIGLQVFDDDSEFEYQGKKGAHALFRVVRHGMRLVEQTGIGAGTSKGFGQIVFEDVKVERLKADDFRDEME